jgi:hypothetical protein
MVLSDHDYSLVQRHAQPSKKRAGTKQRPLEFTNCGVNFEDVLGGAHRCAAGSGVALILTCYPPGVDFHQH